MHVARFFAYGLLGAESSSYLGSSDHVARTIAEQQLRLVLEKHRTTSTPTLKSGEAGSTKVVYGDVEVAGKWLWRSVDGAKTAGERYGRARRVRRPALRRTARARHQAPLIGAATLAQGHRAQGV